MKKLILGLISFTLLLGVAGGVRANSNDTEGIISPEPGEQISLEEGLELEARDDDAEDSGVSWAVRQGTCAAGTNTVAGNVDGFNDDYEWDDGYFTSSLDVSDYDTGEYCFVFNPKAGGRFTREFDIVDVTAPVVTITSPEDGSCVSGNLIISGSVEENYELSHYNISVYPGDADFMDFSQRLEQQTVYRSEGFEDEEIFEWDTTEYDDGEYLIRLAARDAARNRDLSGDPYAGGDDSQHVIKVVVANNKAGVLYCSGVPGKGILEAPGLQKPFNPKSKAKENAGMKK
ncbi:MAG: hypothetical protein ACOC6Q_01935 [Patescibacteria group bacterium]